MDQKPKPSETHSSTFLKDSDLDSDSESEIELRSSHTSPETTTSEESDGTLVDTSLSTTPTPSLLGEGDLDSTEGHPQLLVGTLPLTDKGLPENTQEKHPPPSPSGAEGPISNPSKKTSDNPPGQGDNLEKKVQNFEKARKETVTNPPPEESEHVVTTPLFHLREDSPAEYPPKDQPEASLGSEDGSVIPPIDRTPCVPPDDPFSRFWSGQTADTSDTNKRRYRWLIRKPERRHSVDLDEQDEQDPRPYRYVLRRA